MEPTDSRAALAPSDAHGPIETAFGGRQQRSAAGRIGASTWQDLPFPSARCGSSYGRLRSSARISEQTGARPEFSVTTVIREHRLGDVEDWCHVPRGFAATRARRRR
jgi:hypothetical protein